MRTTTKIKNQHNTSRVRFDRVAYLCLNCLFSPQFLIKTAAHLIRELL